VDKKDELKSEATERLEELREQKEEQKRVQDMLEKCYLGQGALYVVEEQHMVMQDGAMIANGPKFELHKWNKRPTLAANVESFYQTTNNGRLLTPMEQEHALVFAVSRDLVDPSTLAKVKTNHFPDVKFKSGPGNIVVVNGHHRMQVLAKVNEKLLQVKESCLHIVSQSNKGKGRADVVSNTRSDLANAEKSLWENGRWGVILLDLGKWMCDI
jgi:hypothetical protein